MAGRREVEKWAPGPVEPERRTVSYAHTRTLVRLLPALLIAAGVCYDLLSPKDFTAAPFFTAAALVAAPLFSLGATVCTGIVGTAAMALVHLRFAFDVGAVTEVVTVGTVAGLAIVINRLVSLGNARLASAREIAEAAQRAVLPEPAGRIGGLDIAARYVAAQADAFIGGDLYAVQDTPHGVRLVLGDVRGKGMGAVGTVAVVIGAFREAAEHEATLEAVAQRLERALAREGVRRDSVEIFEGFTTAVLAEIPHGAQVVRLVNRGHPGPLLLHGDGTVRTLAAADPSLPLGMGELGGRPDRAQEEALPGGAVLLLHTDGLSEARDERGVFFDPVGQLSGRVFAGPDELLDELVDDVHRYTGGRSTDDMALLAVRRP
ncbi:PP2C family protein-serine/threonine phosphatase [Streptomyces sp. Qhu-G9]|uniref:PP2C family protein-serine/threonine phosphatase n=1 Tax=Streptomyces sp. Qhu-G9 TaxID=3452799 RepID=UPI0022ABD229|nr:PP2C family protein-serine/threonine phosphatase [Streptomyces aurantiacus]WAU85902.1 PP2C family protein-serine/threonine phosphatase [Streptomyces aurantiacus]